MDEKAVQDTLSSIDATLEGAEDAGGWESPDMMRWVPPEAREERVPSGTRVPPGRLWLRPTDAAPGDGSQVVDEVVVGSFSIPLNFDLSSAPFGRWRIRVYESQHLDPDQFAVLNADHIRRVMAASEQYAHAIRRAAQAAAESVRQMEPVLARMAETMRAMDPPQLRGILTAADLDPDVDAPWLRNLYRRFGRSVPPVGPFPETPQERALRLRRERNTGPKAPAFKHRGR